MSSNTLRGIGQEGDGDGDLDGDRDADGNRDADTERVADSRHAAELDSVAAAGEIHTRSSDQLTDRTQDLSQIRSLDSTVPGTRSLDSSVPDATPSLDAKIPALAATLLGVSAPYLAPRERDKGTVHGRDVHLPVEVKRVAGGRAVVVGPTDDSGPRIEARDTRDSNGSTIRIDPALVASMRTERQGDAPNDGSPESSPSDLIKHSPWYDQDPTGGRDVYDDPKPSVLGRAAIGVAVAAGLSVVVFAVIRLSAPNVETDALDTTAAPAPYNAPSEPAGGLRPASVESVPTPSDPVPVPATARAEATDNVLPRPGTATSRADSAPASVGVPGTMGSGAAATTTIPARQAGAARPFAARPTKAVPNPAAAPGSASVADAVQASGPQAAPPPFQQPGATGWTAPTAPTAAPKPASGSELAPAGASTASKPANPEKSRVKANYDPDSTLPLNID
ncbi:MAG: hypothetical protein H7X95_12145 [Deltaproteobacteria bacterium]|nr:hypothetical protein [Deltaproteobacteria bacterium]